MYWHRKKINSTRLSIRVSVFWMRWKRNCQLKARRYLTVQMHSSFMILMVFQWIWQRKSLRKRVMILMKKALLYVCRSSVRKQEMPVRYPITWVRMPLFMMKSILQWQACLWVMRRQSVNPQLLFWQQRQNWQMPWQTVRQVRSLHKRHLSMRQAVVRWQIQVWSQVLKVHLRLRMSLNFWAARLAISVL